MKSKNTDEERKDKEEADNLPYGEVGPGGWSGWDVSHLRWVYQVINSSSPEKSKFFLKNRKSTPV